MLTYRLNGTTEVSVSDRDGQRKCALGQRAWQRPIVAHNLRSSRRAPRGSALLTCEAMFEAAT